MYSKEFTFKIPSIVTVDEPNTVILKKKLSFGNKSWVSVFGL